MKLKHLLLTGSLILFAATLPVHADLFWDGTDLTPNADGGSGTWDTTTLNWDTLATGGTNSAWIPTENAIFGGTSGTVSIAAGGITAANVTFTTDGYTLADNTLAIGAGSITVAPGTAATISSAITGTAGLTKAGTGTLTVSGFNTYTGATTVAAGTLKPAAAVSALPAFRYYRFTVGLNSGGDGYNQIGELHFYKSGVWSTATTGFASGNIAMGNEGYWGNANDNKGANVAGFTKFGTGARPYFITYDFGDSTSLDSYNWSSANDSTPARNPRRWVVAGSNDNLTFTTIDDRSQVDQTGPTATYTWSSPKSVFVTNDNSMNGGAANAFPLAPSAVPATSPLVVASGATFDLNGLNQSVASLADLNGGGGAILNSAAAQPARLTLGTTTDSSFSGTISDLGTANALSLVKISTGTQTLAGATSNTYSGTTTLGGSGKLLLAKTGGAIAIPGNINLSSSAFGGNASGVVLAGDEQIANTSVVTWTSNGVPLFTAANALALAAQSDSFFRLNGHTETIGGLVSAGSTTLPAIENRGAGDTGTYGNSSLILNVTGTNSFSYNGQIRDTDAGVNGLGGKVGLTKIGTGTQILTGGMGNATGPALVSDGILRINGLLGSGSVMITGTGTLQGTGSLSGLVTVQSGGILSPGVAGVGTLTVANPVTIGTTGTLSVTGTSILGGAATIGSGGLLNGTGTVAGAVTVQAGGEISPGTAAIGTLNTNSALTLAGTTTLQINKAGTVFTADQIKGFSKVTYGGTLAIVATGDAAALGDSYQLFSPGTNGTYAGGFSSITGLPTLPAGLQWETLSLLSTGKITATDKTSSPVFGPAAGGYVGAQSVNITADPGATIYYTIDGSDPTTASPSAVGSITGIAVPVDSVLTVKAYSVSPGFGDSAIVTSIYRTVTAPKWAVDADGTWSTATNWVNQVIPNGAGTTADFSFPLTAARTVTLDSSRTIGGLSFSNVNPFTWALASSNSSILTLSVPTGTPTISVTNVDATISTPLAGNQGLLKTGAGVLALSGTNTFSGVTTVTGGTLSVGTLLANGASSQLGTGSTLSLDGGTLRYTGTGSVNFGAFNRAVILGAGGGTIDATTPANTFWFTAGPFSGPGSLTKIGARQLIVQSNNTYDGITFINEGELQIRTVDGLGSTVGKTVVSSPARLAIGSNLVATINETLELNGFGGGGGAFQDNDGGTVVNWAGPISLMSDSGIGGASAFTISAAISGNGGLFKLGTNTITLSGATSNTYAGGTTLGGNGKLLLAKTGGAVAIPGNINLSSTAFAANASGIVLAGEEQIADTAVLTWTAAAYPSGGQEDTYFRLNGHTETIGGLVSLGLGGKVAIENRGSTDTGSYGNGTLIINTTGTSSYTYNGGIRNVDGGTGGGTLALVKTGTGTQILSGGLGYTGTTTVSNGTLEVDAAAVSPITVSGAGAKLTGSGSTSGTLTVATGGTIAPGVAVGTFAAGDTVITGSYACEINGATADRLTMTGSLNLTGASLDFTTLAAPTGLSYVLASYTTDLTSTFTVTGLPVGYAVVYDAVAKEIRLESTSPPQGFAGYATTNGLSGNPAADFDGDGLQDAVEYVLGTSPKAANAGGPTLAVTNGNVVFTFIRDHASITPDVAVAVELSNDLVTWPGVYDVGIDTASSDAGIVVTNNGANDTVTLTVPQGTTAKQFARLKVIVTP